MVIPADNNVWRLAQISRRDKKNKQIPSISVFSLSSSDKADQNRLSVDWDQLTSPEESIARIGATYKTNTTIYKSHTDREIYSIDTTFLKTIESIENTIHDPKEINPAPKGQPNNRAHSLICFGNLKDSEEPEIYTKIRDHAKDRRIEFDMAKTDALVDTYRKQWDDEN